MFSNYLTNLAGSILVGYQEIVCKRSDSYIYKTREAFYELWDNILNIVYGECLSDDIFKYMNDCI